MAKGKIIGIDLGTTNSCVAIVEGGEPVVIANAEGARTTPSIVAYTKDMELLVGQVAKRQAVTNPENTVFSSKRFVGRRYNEVVGEIREVPYKVVAADNGDAHIELRSKVYAPPEISARVLQKMKQTAEDYLGSEVEQAVITVPAYFNDSQRQATKDAGRIAGLDVLRIINEPTAAALAYGLDRDQDEIIAVYDLGGGTFDISVLELGDGVFEVKATNGDTHLGGDDFDQAIIDWMTAEFLAAEGIDLKTDRMALQRLKEEAEKAKIALSGSKTYSINLPFITADASGPKHLTADLSRAKLDELCAPLISRTEGPCLQAMEDAGVTPGEINEVILVGGMSRMPAVQEMVRRLFGRIPNKSVNPDEAVAIGAAIQGAVLSGDVTDVLLLDVTPLSLGLETKGGICRKIIEKNTPIPTREQEIFSTAADNQTAVMIHVLQGERDLAMDNRSLGNFSLEGIPPAPRGEPQIEVTFDIDANGILNVTAKDLATGKDHKVTITASSGIDDSDIDRMVRDARDHADEDGSRREAILARNTADTQIYTAERLMKDAAMSVHLTPEEVAKLTEGVRQTRNELETGNADTLKSVNEAFAETLIPISDKVQRKTGEAKRAEAEKELVESHEVLDADFDFGD